MTPIITRRLTSHGISIIFEDDDILVLDKPAPFLVLPDRFDAELPNMFTILNEVYGKIFVVHQLDKETSGVIIFAKTAEAHAILSEQFAQHTVKKLYSAIVVGNYKKPTGTINLPISEGRHRKMRVDFSNGKESVTHYSIAEELQGYALVEIRPEIGRTHQIRVHMNAINTPILSDELYGKGRNFFLSNIKLNYKFAGEEEHPLLSRTALHASSITCIHPTTKEEQTYVSSLPKDMNLVMKYLRKFCS